MRPGVRACVRAYYRNALDRLRIRMNIILYSVKNWSRYFYTIGTKQSQRVAEIAVPHLSKLKGIVVTNSPHDDGEPRCSTALIQDVTHGDSEKLIDGVNGTAHSIRRHIVP